MNCYIIEQEMAARGDRCIPNAPVLSGGAALTLCGWVDVAYREEEGEPTCGECLTIVRYCKALRLGRSTR